MFGLFGAASSIIGSGINFLSNNATNRSNDKLARYQNDWNLAQWKRENEYNLPINQVQRLREAGLNPNLVYGGGATTLSASSPKAERATMRPYTGWNLGGDSFVNAELGYQRLQKDNELADSQIQVNNQQKLESAQRIAESAARKAGMDFDLGLKKDLRKTQLDTALENLNQVRNSNALSQKQQRMMDLEIDLMPLKKTMTQKQIKQLDLSISKLSVETDLMKFERDLNKLGLTKSDSRFWRILSKAWDYLIGEKRSFVDDWKESNRYPAPGRSNNPINFIDHTRGK